MSTNDILDRMERNALDLQLRAYGLESILEAVETAGVDYVPDEPQAAAFDWLDMRHECDSQGMPEELAQDARERITCGVAAGLLVPLSTAQPWIVRVVKAAA